MSRTTVPKKVKTTTTTKLSSVKHKKHVDFIVKCLSQTDGITCFGTEVYKVNNQIQDVIYAIVKHLPDDSKLSLFKENGTVFYTI